MICYKDRAFCCSRTKEHTCGRELTQKDKEDAETIGLPICMSLFCEEVGVPLDEDITASPTAKGTNND